MSTTAIAVPSAIEKQVWFNRANKRQNDENIYAILFEQLPAFETQRGIVLPGDVWCWEQKLIKKNLKRSWQFWGVNNSPYAEQRKSMVAYKDSFNAEWVAKDCLSRLHTPYGDKKKQLSSFLAETENTDFSVIYADFFGSWCMENNECLRLMFLKKLFRDGAFLIITSQIKCPRQIESNFDILRAAVNGGRSSPNPAFVGMDTPEFKIATQGIETLVKANAEGAGYNANLVYFNMYKGDKKGQNMLSFCYKINKQ